MSALFINARGMMKRKPPGYAEVIADLKRTVERAGEDWQASGGVSFREGNEANQQTGQMQRARQRSHAQTYSRICPAVTNPWWAKGAFA